ncbi:hypothetical protein H5410_059109 [Solanum commersonii]|uniref:Uncharacterized protein n=1 Tax=Solanum commersonii TaxID=4109 RepID=A0A9J5W1V0_SOLCO|nr:hypothetical protein H5410_059109 [Solanum commersonii]
MIRLMIQVVIIGAKCLCGTSRSDKRAASVVSKAIKISCIQIRQIILRGLSHFGYHRLYMW